MRHEVKYLISAACVPAVARRLGQIMSVDSHSDGEGGYDIRSLYFDDEEKSAYFDKVAGVRDRDKYRIRLYNGDATRLYLERKRKRGDGVDKSTLRVSRDLAERIIAGDARGLDGSEYPLLNDMFVQTTVNRLRPIVIVDYRRQAFVHAGGNTRVTIDTRVKSGLGNRDIFDRGILGVDAMDPGFSILEVKYDSMLPDFISAAISCFPGARSALSKYVMCCRYVI